MAVNETGAIFKGFTFDGIDSKDYGVYISGDAVFNAPERDVEMIDIPGRNGSYALDKGRFANITVTYPAGLFGDTEADFAQGISDLRNALASRKGYCRLEDEYNPNEYRMAIYRSGLDVEPASLKSGEFDIVFDCKPQRFLKSGETAVEVTSGGAINNPTLFESRPLLEVYGYGGVTMNDATINVYNTGLGNVTVYNGGSVTRTTTMTATIDDSLASVGDVITLERDGATFSTMFRQTAGMVVDNGEYTVSGADLSISAPVSRYEGWTITASFNPSGSDVFTYGTSKTLTSTITMTCEINSDEETQTVALSLAYDGADTFTLSATTTASAHMTVQAADTKILFKQITMNCTSTIPSLYIDLDIGECYFINNGEAIPANNIVELPAELPTLKPNANTITYDNTITRLEVVPHWWEV